MFHLRSYGLERFCARGELQVALRPPRPALHAVSLFLLVASLKDQKRASEHKENFENVDKIAEVAEEDFFAAASHFVNHSLPDTAINLSKQRGVWLKS